MTKIDDFGGPAYLAWTRPKFGNTMKMTKIVKNLSWNKKMTESCCKSVDFILDTEFKG